jgi:hypothetical protein
VSFQGVTVVKTTPFNYGWQGQMAPLACGFGMRNGVQGSSAGDSSGKVSRRKRKKLGLVEFWRTVETEAMDSFVLTLRAEGDGGVLDLSSRPAIVQPSIFVSSIRKVKQRSPWSSN